MIKTISKIGYNYATIRVTQSRIDKGLLAIPVALIAWFPRQNTQVKVFFGDSAVPQVKNYTAYNSSSRECRIGGLGDWFKENQIKDGYEIVIQVIDKDNFAFRLIPEEKFILKTQEIQNAFDNSADEKEAVENLIQISNWTDVDRNIVKLNEFYRLVNEAKIEERKKIAKKGVSIRENVPASLKITLNEIYLGHCQVCDFWFLKKDRTPYFEIHHIETELGNHPKNLLVVCGNCHNQFTYANIEQEFKDGWLSKVCFNEREFEVNQIVFKQNFIEPIKEVFI